MSMKLEALNNYRWLGVVVILHHHHQHLKCKISWSLRHGQIAYQFVCFCPSHTEEDRALFVLVTNVICKEKVL